MKFTLSWLRDHLETEAGLPEITETLTRIGLELEGVEDKAQALAAFRVAYVVEAKQHPNADRLKVCIVDTGAGQVQVVCGAPNARTGMKGVFAPTGTHIPGTGIDLKASKIRGVESNGMLVSERELGLSDEHEGIIDLPADAPVGKPFAEIMGLTDPVIDVAVTPNRQDCLGVRGIARDLAAAGLGKLRPFQPAKVEGRFKSPIPVEIENREACPCFAGRYFRGVKNGPSPDWMQRRLRAIGLRPISALVDITNYVTFDLGRPLHVFDAAKVKGTIRARLGRPGETLLALNGKEYAIDETMTVIADDEGPEGLGGVMGGEHSGVTEATTEVMLEVALFDPLRTAATGRRLAIESDARYRFERGVDPGMVLPGAEYAAKLILELCGGEASEPIVAGSPDVPPRVVTYRPARLASLAGLDLPEAEQRRILDALGFAVTPQGDAWQVTAPTWRSDIHGEADIVEEAARIAGYDNIPAEPLPALSVVAKPALTPAQRRRPQARRALAARGLLECVTFSFLSRDQARLFGGGDERLVLENPIASELDCMRPSLLPNLLAAARRNRNRGFEAFGLFEVGPQYAGDGPSDQAFAASGIRVGGAGPRHWSGSSRAIDLFDAKADALGALASVGAIPSQLQAAAEAPAWYHPGRSGVLRLGPQNALAWFGDLHPRVLESFGLEGPVVAFEAFIERVPAPKVRESRSRGPLEVSDFPAVARDFAFLVDAAVPAADIVKAARGADRQLVAEVNVFDVYAGERMAAGKKSIAISVRLEPKERTLTDPEIEAVAAKIVAAVKKAAGAELRA
jgi:phenylalanyl-tRNA synthetase beta chain